MSSQGLAVRILPEVLQSLAFGSITSSYVLVGTLGNPSRILLLQNSTDGDALISFDGTNDNAYLPAGGFILLDLTANRSNVAQGAYIAQGTKIYAKSSASLSKGSIYLTTFYGANVTV